MNPLPPIPIYSFDKKCHGVEQTSSFGSLSKAPLAQEESKMVEEKPNKDESGSVRENTTKTYSMSIRTDKMELVQKGSISTKATEVKEKTNKSEYPHAKKEGTKKGKEPMNIDEEPKKIGCNCFFL